MLADHYVMDALYLGSLSQRKGREASVLGDLEGMRRIATLNEEIARHARKAERVKTAQRFVLSPQIVEAAWDLSQKPDALESSRDHLFTPAHMTWLEWLDQDNLFGYGCTRVGVLLDGDYLKELPDPPPPSVVIGAGYIVRGAPYDQVRTTVEHGFLYDFPGDGAMFQPLPLSDRPEKFTPQKVEALERFGRFVGACLALINTPRIAHVVKHDVSKLNKARMRANKVPLLTYKDLTISPDSGWVSKTEARKATDEKRRHHVRTFMRIKRGKVELVSPHWRGNRAKGYVLHRHIIRREEEEAGTWKGPPMTGDQIIKPGTMDGLTNDID